MQVGESYDMDPRLFAAMAIAENGQYQNNPFGLGPNGSKTFASLGDAIAYLGRTLDRYINQWKETTVSALWSGNVWIVKKGQPWITLQYPGYCVGNTAEDKAGCQHTGVTISGFMRAMGGDPDDLRFPCKEDD